MSLFTTLQNIVPQQALSEFAGKLASSKNPTVKRFFIRGFATVYGIKLDEYAREHWHDYQSFNDFFTRELKDGVRPIDQKDGGVVCPADGKVSQIGQIKQNQILQAKGKNYDVGQLLADHKLGKAMQDGSFATIYLAPTNYHRVHMPFSGTLVQTIYIPGQLFSVNHETAENIPDLFARNERCVCVFDTEFGTACVVLVGAMIVAGIETVATGKLKRTDQIQTQNHNLTLQKGDELGRFYLGSTAIVLLPKSAGTAWQGGLHNGTAVKMGQLLGICYQSPKRF
ncbi:phosphatidylserine decarboxylase [Moraxella macacae 0408225]|uniref:Phosphatidylserine decarboxylase proenzyme n=1 Tax=Moraxella macacae 0408225 TaxID=1230338 RepID=L2F7D8_9GAMM|nr:archaetidylserine decarboxylase [Moraxella macacae]ELA08947.1 phosphatidylserine decarboxylase [Moraxella macacae 0408225]